MAAIDQTLDQATQDTITTPVAAADTTTTAEKLLALAQGARQAAASAKATRDAQLSHQVEREAGRLIAKFQAAMDDRTLEAAAAKGLTQYPLDFFYPPNSTMPDGTKAPWVHTHTAVTDGIPRIMAYEGPRPNDSQGRPMARGDTRLLPGGRTALDIANDSLPPGFYLIIKFSPKTTRNGAPNPYFKRNNIYLTWGPAPTPAPRAAPPAPRTPAPRTPAPRTPAPRTPAPADDADPLQALANLCLTRKPPQ